MGTLPRTPKAIRKHQGRVEIAKDYSKNIYPTIFEAGKIALSRAKKPNIPGVIIPCPRSQCIEPYELIRKVFGKVLVPKNNGICRFRQTIYYSNSFAPTLVSEGSAWPGFPFKDYQECLFYQSVLELPPRISAGNNKFYGPKQVLLAPAFEIFLANYKEENFAPSRVARLGLEYVMSSK